MTETRPKFIVLRPADRWDRTRAAFATLDIDLVFADVLTYIPTHTPLPPLTGIGAIIITSLRAITSLKEIPDGLKSLPLYVVGTETARSLRDMGFTGPQTVAPTAEALAPLINDSAPIHQNYLYIRGADVAVQFRNIIKNHVILEHTAYRGLPKSGLSEDIQTALRDDPQTVGIMFFSRETTRAFWDMADRAGIIPNFSRLHALCLSPSVLGSSHPEDFKQTITAPTPDLIGMVHAVRACLQQPEDIPVTEASARAHDTDTANNNMIANADAIIERFGGIRPMANKLGVPVTTVQGWKKRGVIPANRAALIEQAAHTHGVETTGLIHIVSGNTTTHITLPRKATATAAVPLSSIKALGDSVSDDHTDVNDRSDLNNRSDVNDRGDSEDLSDSTNDPIDDLSTEQVQEILDSIAKTIEADKATSALSDSDLGQTQSAQDPEPAPTGAPATDQTAGSTSGSGPTTGPTTGSGSTSGSTTGSTAGPTTSDPSSEKPAANAPLTLISPPTQANDSDPAPARRNRPFMNRRKSDKIARATWLAVILLATAIIVGLMAMTPGIARIKDQDAHLKTLASDIDHLNQEIATLRRENALLSGLVPRDLKDRIGVLQERAENIESTVSNLGTETKALTAGVLGSDENSIEGRLSTVETKLGDVEKTFSSERMARFVLHLATLESADQANTQITSLVQALYGALPVDTTTAQFPGALKAAIDSSPDLQNIFDGLTPDEQPQATLLLVLAHMRHAVEQDRVSMDQDMQLLSLILPNQKQILNDLAPFAKDGVRSVKGLATDFKVMSDNAVDAMFKDPTLSWTTRLWAQIHNKLRIEHNGQSLTGTETQRILDQAAQAMNKQDIASTITALQSLNGDPAKLAAPWVMDAEHTLRARAEIATLTKIVSATLSLDPASLSIINNFSPKSDASDIAKAMAASMDKPEQSPLPKSATRPTIQKNK